MSRRWKTKYEQCSQAVRDKLDKLDEMYINEYQLQVIKRKRIYPDIGDIFKICPRENIECVNAPYPVPFLSFEKLR